MVEPLIAFAILLALVFARVPLVYAMSLVGFFGVARELGYAPAFAMIANTVLEAGFSYSLSVVPLFVLMGNFATRAGLSRELYAASYAFLGHRKGGLAMATVVACGGFGAICGSSLATAATMAKVAMPQMRRYGYSDALAAGSIAAGGTLGIMIPPSVIMVIYALITEQSVGVMFAAGLIPGILAVACYIGAVKAVTLFNPTAGPAGERGTWRQRLVTLRDVWGVIALFAVVMGGIYAGVFTPTEAAGVGAGGAFLFALSRGKLDVRSTFDVLFDSAKTTTMLFSVLIGALIFANYINYSGMPDGLAGWVTSLDIHPLTVVIVIILIYLVLGCALESISMILLTVPVFYPVVQALGFDLIWFGIIVVCVVEISLITPPIGLNVFVLRTVLQDVPLKTIFRGVMPFIGADVVRLAILVAFPALSLWLPAFLFGR